MINEDTAAKIIVGALIVSCCYFVHLTGNAFLESQNKIIVKK